MCAAIGFKLGCGRHHFSDISIRHCSRNMSIEVFDNYFKAPGSAALSGPSCIMPQEGRKIVTVKDVEPEQFIKAFSQHLKRQGRARTLQGHRLPRHMACATRGRFELPKWADVVKTSKAKELPPSAPGLRLMVSENALQNLVDSEEKERYSHQTVSVCP